VEGNMIPNCNITRQDILRVEDIFGPNLQNHKTSYRTFTHHMDTGAQRHYREIWRCDTGN